MTNESPQFVVQFHSGHGPTHYDLMLEHGGALATWRLDASPAGLAAGESMPARKLADHRKHYLTYQGPVSGGRGEVRILDRGRYELAGQTDDLWEVALHGGALKGRYELRRLGGGDWVLQRLAAT